MSITSNESGTLYELSGITVNESGTLYELDTVHSNESGTLQEIFAAYAIPIPSWRDLTEDGTELYSGYSWVGTRGQSKDICVIFSVKGSTKITISGTLSTLGGSSGSSVSYSLNNRSTGEQLTYDQKIGTGAFSYSVIYTGELEDGDYTLDFGGGGASGSQSGVTNYGYTFDIVLEFEKA